MHVVHGSILSEFFRTAKCTIKLSDFVLKAKHLFLKWLSKEQIK